MPVNDPSVELDNIDDTLIHTRHPFVFSIYARVQWMRLYKGGGGGGAK